MPAPIASTRLTTAATTTTAPSSGGRLVAVDGRDLPLRATHLATDAGLGIARTRLTQRFANPYAEPLAVTYQLPLPADGAVAGFSFTIGDRRIQGEIDRRAAARERFEEAIATGRTAALLEQDRDSVFTQEVGNIPPGAEITAEITVDQPLRWLDGGQWEWRFPTALAPRYLGALGVVADAQRITVDVADAPLPPRLTLALSVRDALTANGQPTSPSHPLLLAREASGVAVTFASEGPAPLDRDVVVRWGVGTASVGASLATARPAADRPHAASAYGLLTLVPPASLDEQAGLARDLIVLLDTSGSMHGEPIAQSKAVTLALIDTLTERDHLEMISFASRPERWSRRPVRMDARGRQKARHWILNLQAGGGTEMHRAILEALQPLDARAQRQVLLITDGLIGFEQNIVREVLTRLPQGARLHTLGVGSAPNRSLTQAAARAGRGVEALVALGEDPAAAAARLVSATRTPLVGDLELSGSALQDTAPACLPDLFGGAPARLALQLCPGGGALIARGRTANGEWRQQIAVPAVAHASGRGEIVSLFGREQVADLETQVAAGQPGEHDARLEQIGLAFQLATRLTSWVAVCAEPTVDPTEPTRHERMPHELPHGMSIESLGLRRACAPMPAVGRLSAALPSGAGAAQAELQEGLADRADLGQPAPRGPMGRSRAQKRRAADDEEERSAKHEQPIEAAFLPPAEPVEPAAQAPAPPRVRRGRVTVRRDGWLVVEIDADGTAWLLPDEVYVRLADGSEVLAEVDVGSSTRSGAVHAAATIRLSLRLQGGGPVALRLVYRDRAGGTGIQVEVQVQLH